MRFAGSIAALRSAKKVARSCSRFEFYDYLIRRRIVKLRSCAIALIRVRVNDLTELSSTDDGSIESVTEDVCGLRSADRLLHFEILFGWR